MNITPILDRIVIERVPRETSPIIIVDDTKPTHGRIIAKGNKVSLKEGDLVAFPESVGVEIELDGRNLVVMKEEDVFGVVSA